MTAASLLLVLLVAQAGGPRPASPAAPAAPIEGAGLLQGTVVDTQRHPIANAVVTLTGAGLGTGRAAVTNIAGAFAFDRLPAGAFMLAAAKPAYVKTTFGATNPGGSGTPVSLADGQQVRDLVLTMPHGGAISGVIRDERGEPVPNLLVTIIRTDDPNPRPSSTDRNYTDDRGAYRVYGLLPGTYLVAASLSVTGGIGGVGRMSVAEVDQTLARLRERGTAGPAIRREEPARSPSSIVRPERIFLPAPVFFPGVSAAGAATLVPLALAEDRTGVDFVYQLVRTGSISGIVSGAGNASVSLTLSPEDGPALPAGLPLGGSTSQLLPRTSSGDGPFTFTSVLPGRYRLLAGTGGSSAELARISVLVGVGMLPPSAQRSSSDPVLYAEAAVDVSNDDVLGVTLALEPAARVSGRVVFPDNAAPASNELAPFRLTLVSARQQGGPTRDPAAPSTGVEPDGTFEFSAVPPGSYRLATTPPPHGWLAASALLNGRDIFDVPVDVSTTSLTGVQLTLSDRHASLTGRLVDAAGTPAPGYFVVIFSADRTTWAAESRRSRSARPATDGAFRFEDVVPGEYYLAALTDADSDAWRTPSFLAAAAQAAIAVTVRAGEQTRQDVRVGR